MRIVVFIFISGGVLEGSFFANFVVDGLFVFLDLYTFLY
eukprot:UN22779